MSHIVSKFLSPNILVWIITFELISVAIGFSSNSGTDPWYLALNKPPLNPPSYLFGIVWPFLYFLLAIFGWSLSKKNKPEAKILFVLFWVQMLLNWSWSPVFFNLYSIGYALLILIALVSINAYLITKLFFLQMYNLIYIILPYFLWICFAMYLNTYLFVLN